MSSISLFVPGRLCLFGEHSDWAGMYRTVNADIEKGLAIVTGTEQGIYALAEKADTFIMCGAGEISEDEHWECDMDSDKLLDAAQKGGYFSYVAGVASYINDNYSVGGIKITVVKRDLPLKSGLSSSAAICVLVARAFNQLYDLKMSIKGEMQAAFRGEQRTPSRCGRLDQACAYGLKPVLMEFSGVEIDSKEIHVGGSFYWVVANLMASKDTIKILSDLNRSYPFAESDSDKKVQEALGSDNRRLVLEAVKKIEEGDARGLGELMIKAQQCFDEKVMPACDELKAPVLHSVLHDPEISKWVYGAKGVGSQGDGTVQFLAKSEKDAEHLSNYLLERRGMPSFFLTIKPGQNVKKAIIPLAGYGTRLFPATKCMKKCFMPIIDTDGLLKPALLIMLEQLIEAGIEEISLIIGSDEQEMFDKFFAPVSDSCYGSLSSINKECENKILEISKRIKYIYQNERNGFGHAIWLAKEFANNEPVLLLLGDFLYHSNTNLNCSVQMINAFKEYGKPIVSINEVKLNNVVHYGILSGVWDDDERLMKANQMVEKPTLDFANDYLGVKNTKGEVKYYSTFGQYILTSDVFNDLDNEVKNFSGKGEIGLTEVLDRMAKNNNLIGFVPEGKSFDIGIPEEYRNAFCNYS